MKRAIAAKYQQYLCLSKERGFTLIELIVVFFIIGILSAIALPSLLSKTNSNGCLPPGSEQRQNVGAMNRAQQAYFLEHNKFATLIEELGVRIKPETENYVYSIIVRKEFAFNYATPTNKGENQRKSYVGGVFLITNTKVEAKADKDEVLTEAVLCETNEISNAQAANPIYKNGEIICDPSTKNLGK